MSRRDRLDQITELVDESGFLSVAELSKLLNVSEMTIRRDLEQLDMENRLQRTYGGAVPHQKKIFSKAGFEGDGLDLIEQNHYVPLGERIDVLITTALNPKYDGLLLESLDARGTLPIIAESLSTQKGEPVVAVDNYLAGKELGRWAAGYAIEHWQGRAFILDLTYYLANTQTRSRGFIGGVKEMLPEAEVVLSLDAQSRYETAYQLTRDALTVHPQINLIFAINDIIAWGAI